MNAKERFYSGLAKETIGKITSNTDNWTSFLRTMSRNYEFTYPEQVMIYAQRPNATFCKPYEDWNAENYRRYVKRGSTGIALFVMNRDKPYLRYVFDVADTGVRRSSPELKPWEVTPENRSYLYQTLENKQKFISQIMTSKSPVRSCDDVDEQALSYAEIKALCAGNPLIKEKMDLDIDVARLKVLKADHQSQQYRMEDKLLKYFPAEIEKQTGYIHGFEADIKTVEAHPQIADGFCGMEIMGKAYTEKADAGEILLAACKDTKSADPVPLGSYRGFQMELSFDSFRNEFDVTLKGAVSHRVALGTDARGNITRLDNALAGILERLERANEQLNNLYNQQEAAKAEVGKPFPQEAELTAKSQRLAELDAALNMEDSVENRDERSESERPSVLADLKSKAEHIPPAKYSETREEVL